MEKDRLDKTSRKPVLKLVVLIAADGHPRAIMERMGHSSIQITLDTYGHLFPGLDEALTDGLETAFRDASSADARPVRGLDDLRHSA